MGVIDIIKEKLTHSLEPRHLVNANESTSHASRVGALADWESRSRIKIVSGAFSDFSAWTGNEWSTVFSLRNWLGRFTHQL